MKKVILFGLMVLFLLAGVRGIFVGGTSNEAIMLEFFLGLICGVAVWQNKQSKKAQPEE